MIIRNIKTITLGIILIGCSNREPLNPLDPNNPFTDGRPTGLSLIPIQNTVQILWDSIDLSDISNYTIYRGILGSEMIKLKEVASGSTSFLDTTVSLYETYTYAIEVKMENYISDRSDTVQVTIGPFNIYAADFWDNSIRIVSWDGNHLITTKYVSSPRSMSLRRTDKRFCVADYYDRSLLLITADLLEIESIPLPDYPLDLDLDQDQGMVYVATRDGYIVKIDKNNDIILDNSLGTGLVWDTQVSFDHLNKGLWVTIPDSGTVIFYPVDNGTTDIKYFGGFKYPSAVSAHGHGWVADSMGLYRITTDGDIESILTNTMVTDAAIDTINLFCFYTGYDYSTSSWIAGRVSLETLVNETILDNAYPYLYNIFPIPSDNGAEFLLQQSYTWKILRVSENGSLIGDQYGYNGRISFQVY